MYGPACGTGGLYVKRIVAQPGETWAERNGAVFVDGKRLNEPYVKPAYVDHYTYPPQKIPSGRYFMMGDNRSGSCDSRKWGTVPAPSIIGKVVGIRRPG